MMKRTVVTALWLASGIAFAAPPRVEPLKPVASPRLAESFHERAFAAYQKKDYVSALALLDRAIALQPDEFRYWKVKALVHGKLGQYPQAFNAAERTLQLYPDFAEGYEIRGTSRYFLHQDSERVLADYRKALELDFRSANFFKNYLEVLKETKRYDEMKAVYDRYAELRRDDPDSIDGAETGDIPFYAGVAYYNTGDFRRAIELYTEALRISPDYDGYYVNRAGAYDELKEYTKALDDFARAIQWNPKNANAFYNRGVTFLTLERHDEALRDFLRAQQLGQNDLDIWLNIGASYAHLKRYPEALRAYDTALKIDPRNGQVLSNRANVLRDLGRSSEAASNAAAAMQALPANKQAGVLYNQTTPLMESKDYAKAIALLTQAVALDPGLSQAWGRLSHAYFQMGNFQKALDATNEGIRADPNLPEHYLNRGLIYMKTGQPDLGLRDYRTAERLRPGDIDAMVRIALAYAEADQSAEALRIYETLAKTNPKLVDFYINYSALLLDMDEGARALGVTKQGIVLHPGNYNLLVNHANAQSENQDFDGAIDTYRKAMRADPAKVSAPYNLANLYMLDMSQPAKSIEWYDKAMQLDPTLFAAYLNLASAYTDSGNPERALHVLGDAIQRFPLRYEAAFNRAGILHQIGRASQAQPDYALALKRIDGLLPRNNLSPTSDQLEIMGYQAFILYRIGRTREAMPLMARVVALSPSATEFRRNYGFMLLDLQRPQEASVEFAHAFADEPNEVDSWIGMMAAAYLNGDKTALAQQKKQFVTRFGAKYPLDLSLLTALAKEKYWYSDAFQKVWRHIIASP